MNCIIQLTETFLRDTLFYFDTTNLLRRLYPFLAKKYYYERVGDLSNSGPYSKLTKNALPDVISDLLKICSSARTL